MCRRNLLSRILLLLFFAALPGLAVAQNPNPVDPCTDPNCLTDKLNISTGYDHSTNAIYSIGQFDSYWTVVQDPSANTTEPRPAAVIPQYVQLGGTSWGPAQNGSQWISAYPTSENDTNGVYIFEYCFCVCPAPGSTTAHIDIDLNMLADDDADVYLNGVLIGSSTNLPPLDLAFQVTTSIISSLQLPAGKNCIRIELENIFSVAMGLNIQGLLYSPNNELADPLCCNTSGTIVVRKYDDKNCDGILDSGDQPMSGWTFQLNGGTQSATSDANGYAYFSNLPAGTYTITEIGQPGWIQTFPTGSHTVNVSPGGSSLVQVFLNCDTTSVGDSCALDIKTKVECCEPGQHGNSYELDLDLTWQGTLGAAHGVFVNSLTPGVALSPTQQVFSPSLTTGASSGPLNFGLSGLGTLPGTQVCIEIIMYGPPSADGTPLWICPPDTICFRLPNCEGCCDTFFDDVKVENIIRPTPGGGATVNTTFIGFSQSMSAARATLVSSVLYRYFCTPGQIVSVQPACGFINGGVLSAPLPGPTQPYADPNYPSSNSIYWGVNNCGVDFSNAEFELDLSFLPGPSRGCRDKIRFCVLYEFTDENCVTCDTLICYEFTRGFFVDPGDDDVIKGLQDDGSDSGSDISSAELNNALFNEAAELGIVMSLPQPNPTTGAFSVQIQFAENQNDVELLVFDAQGKRVKTLFSGRAFAAGEHILEASLAEFSSGVYILALRAAQHTIVRNVKLGN